MQTPFAIQLYEQCVRGRTPAQLAAETGIPLERVRIRVFAAINYFKDNIYEVSKIRVGAQDTLLGMTARTAAGTQIATMMWSIHL
jgi:hypothetical protein